MITKINLGWVHSHGINILPFGNANCMRFMLESYKKGDFWNRCIADEGKQLKDVYIDRRSYKEQLMANISQDPAELLLQMNCYKYTSTHYGAMMIKVLKKVFDLGYKGEIIVTGINEPLEVVSQEKYIKSILTLNHWLTYYGLRDKVKLCAGDESGDKSTFYMYIFDKLAGVVDYFSFHTPNSANLEDTKWILENIPTNHKAINSEFYCWNLARKLGYDHKEVIGVYFNNLELMISYNHMKSIYCLFPSIYWRSKYYSKLGLQRTNKDLAIRHVTKTYKLLERWWKTRWET